MRLVAAVLLAYSSSAFAATGMSSALQRDAPVQIQSATYGVSEALVSAVFTNRSGKVITAYQIGWISVIGGNAEVHQSVEIKTPSGIADGSNQTMPAQGIPINTQAKSMTFFVSHVSFADGTEWSAPENDPLEQAVPIY